MQRIRYGLLVLFAALLVCITPAASMAQERGIEIKIVLVEESETYEVFMRSTDTLETPHRTLTSQVTIKVPHGVNAERFEITDLSSAVAGTDWTVASRIDAPSEATNFDYLSFDLSFPTGDQGAYEWKAGEEIKVFSFKNSGACLGGVTLIEDDDPFMYPNSVNTNPGNNVDVLVIPTAEELGYIGNYEQGNASCMDTRDFEHGILLPVIRK